MTRRLMPYGVLLLLGVGWGATQPLTKFAVDAGYHPLGMILWQLVVAVLVLGALTRARRRSLWPGRQGLAICAIVALCGTVLPNSASYLALGHLPAGVMA
ncbi:EamA/RhaT family transporter, partial [Thioclava sp. BHET1]